VPIKDKSGNVIAAFNLYGPKFRLEDTTKRQQIVAVLLKGAVELEQMLL
jgi:DNA-binding IclR family transcriptional regulator